MITTIKKWLSPYLTDISRQYCKDEFIKDTDEFLECINALNLEQAAIPKTQRQNFKLATLDVAALYPSIRTTVALDALEVVFSIDTTTGIKFKEALINFSKLLFEKSYVKYKDKCYQPLVGIPTGGCNSRQTADCLLHYLVEKVKGDILTWNLLKLFKRFIDDIFTLWLGTRTNCVEHVEFLLVIGHLLHSLLMMMVSYSCSIGSSKNQQTRASI